MQQYAMTYGIVIGQIINENNALTPGKNKKDNNSKVVKSEVKETSDEKTS